MICVSSKEQIAIVYSDMMSIRDGPNVSQSRRFGQAHWTSAERSPPVCINYVTKLSLHEKGIIWLSKPKTVLDPFQWVCTIHLWTNYL